MLMKMCLLCEGGPSLPLWLPPALGLAVVRSPSASPGPGRLEPGGAASPRAAPLPPGEGRAIGRYRSSKICSGLTVIALPHQFSFFAASMSRRDTRGFEPSLLFCSENDPCCPEAKCVGRPPQSCHSSLDAQPAASVAIPIITITGDIYS